MLQCLQKNPYNSHLIFVKRLLWKSSRAVSFILIKKRGNPKKMTVRIKKRHMIRMTLSSLFFHLCPLPAALLKEKSHPMPGTENQKKSFPAARIFYDGSKNFPVYSENTFIAKRAPLSSRHKSTAFLWLPHESLFTSPQPSALSLKTSSDSRL